MTAEEYQAMIAAAAQYNRTGSAPVPEFVQQQNQVVDWAYVDQLTQGIQGSDAEKRQYYNQNYGGSVDIRPPMMNTPGGPGGEQSGGSYIPSTVTFEQIDDEIAQDNLNKETAKLLGIDVGGMTTSEMADYADMIQVVLIILLLFIMMSQGGF